MPPKAQRCLIRQNWKSVFVISSSFICNYHHFSIVFPKRMTYNYFILYEIY